MFDEAGASWKSFVKATMVRKLGKMKPKKKAAKVSRAQLSRITYWKSYTQGAD